MSITLVVISILSVQMVKAQYKVDAELVESSKYKSPTTVQAEYSYARGQRFYSYKNDIECFSLSSEFESTLALAPHLTMYLNGTYTYGRERTITMTQDYLPNTSNLSLLGGISIYNTNNLNIQLSYEWDRELEVGSDKPFQVSGPTYLAFSIDYSKKSWFLSARTHRTSHNQWDGAIFDIENQELGEPQSISENLFRPGNEFAFIVTVQYNL